MPDNLPAGDGESTVGPEARLQTLVRIGLLTWEDEQLVPGERYDALVPAILTAAEADVSGDGGVTPRLDPTSKARMVAHDLRTPLTVASGHLELASEQCSDADFDAIRDAHARIGALVEEMVSTDGGTVSPESLDRIQLHEIASTTWSSVGQTGSWLEFGSDRHLLADRDQLERLFENLFRNSIEHNDPDSAPRDGPNTPTVPTSTTGSGSVSELTTGAEATSEVGDLVVRVGALEDGTGFFVEDDGRGIPSGEQEQIFDLGYSTAGAGTGVGLASVARIAAVHGWSIAVTAGPDGGARFEFSGVRGSD